MWRRNKTLMAEVCKWTFDIIICLTNIIETNWSRAKCLDWISTNRLQFKISFLSLYHILAFSFQPVCESFSFPRTALILFVLAYRKPLIKSARSDAAEVYDRGNINDYYFTRRSFLVTGSGNRLEYRASTRPRFDIILSNPRDRPHSQNVRFRRKRLQMHCKLVVRRSRERRRKRAQTRGRRYIIVMKFAFRIVSFDLQGRAGSVARFSPIMIPKRTCAICVYYARVVLSGRERII